jgi:hypothetical protein
MTFSVHLLSIVSLGFHPQQEIEKVKKIFVEGVVIKQLYIFISKLPNRLKRRYNKILKPAWTEPAVFRILLKMTIFVFLLLIIHISLVESSARNGESQEDLS